MDEVELFDNGQKMAIVLVPKNSRFDIVSWQGVQYVRKADAVYTALGARTETRRARYERARIFTAMQLVTGTA